VKRWTTTVLMGRGAMVAAASGAAAKEATSKMKNGAKRFIAKLTLTTS
jgi:hypothetical protein